MAIQPLCITAKKTMNNLNGQWWLIKNIHILEYDVVNKSDIVTNKASVLSQYSNWVAEPLSVTEGYIYDRILPYAIIGIAVVKLHQGSERSQNHWSYLIEAKTQSAAEIRLQRKGSWGDLGSSRFSPRWMGLMLLLTKLSTNQTKIKLEPTDTSASHGI